MDWQANPVYVNESRFPFLPTPVLCPTPSKTLAKIGATEHHISPQNYSPQKRRGPSSREVTMEMLTSRRKRNKDGRGLTSPASSCRSWKRLSRGTDTRTWAPERRSQCGPTSRRPESGYENPKSRAVINICINITFLPWNGPFQARGGEFSHLLQWHVYRMMQIKNTY